MTRGRRGRPGHRGLWYALLTLLILALLAVGGYFLINNFLGDTSRCPTSSARERTKLAQTLEDAGFEVAVERRPNKRPEGRVFEQDPEAGESLEEGGTRHASVVSTGPATVRGSRPDRA